MLYAIVVDATVGSQYVRSRRSVRVGVTWGSSGRQQQSYEYTVETIAVTIIPKAAQGPTRFHSSHFITAPEYTPLSLLYLWYLGFIGPMVFYTVHHYCSSTPA